MKQPKSLDMNALEKRVAKTVTTEEALRDVAPFAFAPVTDQTKITVDKDTNNV